MAVAPTTKRTRTSSEDRREQVLSAAIIEFAAHGYQGASTSLIAKRAGISQPYLYALFSNKQELFLECHRRVIASIRGAFIEASRGATSPEDALERMGEAYKSLIEEKDELLFQLQTFAAAGSPEVRTQVQRGFLELWDDIERLTGAPRGRVAAFIAMGMLCNIATALELPEEYGPPYEDQWCK